MANFTGEGKYTSKLIQALSAPSASISELFSALNIFLSITTAESNGLILIAIKNAPSIHPPTKLCFRCLAATDLCVGFVVQPFYATFIMSFIIEMNVNVLYYVNKVRAASSFILCGVSVLTSTAISVDRVFALLLGLRYRHVVTLKRVHVVITCFWLMAASDGSLWLWRRAIALQAASVVLIICMITSIFCYTRIHLKPRPQRMQVQNNVSQGHQIGERIALNIAKYKKSVSSIMRAQLALVACYVPFVIVSVLEMNATAPEVAWFATETLVFLNSSLNPILYCWKIREVKRAVKGTIRQLYCFN